MASDRGPKEREDQPTRFPTASWIFKNRAISRLGASRQEGLRRVRSALLQTRRRSGRAKRWPKKSPWMIRGWKSIHALHREAKRLKILMGFALA